MVAARIALLVVGYLAGVAPLHASVMTPFVSELHYDNTGADVAEFVALTGPSGLDVDGWRLALYNGANGRVYRSLTLSGSLHGSPGGFAELAVDIAGIQNGPDAVALISDLGDVMDFIAYENTVLASDGAAAGLTAHLLPLSESGATRVGESLQRVGPLSAMRWAAGPASPGRVNAGLQLTAATATSGVVSPLPVALWLAGLGSWWAARRRGVD